MENCNTSSPEGKRQTQVSEEMAQTSKALDQLDTIIGTLMDRLSPVLREPEPCTDCEKSVQQQLVPIAEQVRKMRQGIINETDRLDDVLKRLEV